MIGFEELRHMQADSIAANSGGVDSELLAMGVDPLSARQYADSIAHVAAQHRMRAGESMTMAFLAGLTLGYRVRDRKSA